MVVYTRPLVHHSGNKLVPVLVVQPMVKDEQQVVVMLVHQLVMVLVLVLHLVVMLIQRLVVVVVLVLNHMYPEKVQK